MFLYDQKQGQLVAHVAAYPGLQGQISLPGRYILVVVQREQRIDHKQVQLGCIRINEHHCRSPIFEQVVFLETQCF